mgnify:CR=1 FL=1
MVTLGGECSTSVVPFTYMAHRYGGDVAMVWIDAHPDITLPGDPYAGYHAMAVTACMGMGDKKITSALPAAIPAERIMIVGLRDWERDDIRLRQQQLGIAHLAPEDVVDGSDALTDWLRRCGASKVVVHFYMDVLDPSEIIAAVGVVPGGMKMAGVVRDIAERCRQTMISDGSCGMRELKAWVLSTMITKDPYESALSTIIASASADPDNRADLISTCLEKQYVR